MTEIGSETEPPAGRRALDGVVVVLYQTQDLVNIAGTIRAMKNFGVRRLRLVSPADWDPWRIEGIAHDTRDMVETAEHFDDIEVALADCSLVVGFTARPRRSKRNVARPRALAAQVLERSAEALEGEAGPVALLYGREDHGLPNEALDLCHLTSLIPTAPEHSSLNLAHAVGITCYELWMAAEGATQPFRPPRRDAPPATVEQLEGMFTAVERALWSIDFFKSRQPESVMRTLREVARRGEMDAREAGFLRAMAIEVVKYGERLRALGEGQGDDGPGGA
jgi:TrmH family RNA methyltransferase